MIFLAEKYGIDLNDAVINTGNINRLAGFLKTAEKGGSLSVVAFGGSITQGSLASSVEKSYTCLFTEYLRNKFPSAQIRYTNAGIGGTGSLYGAFRLKRDVKLHKPDLVLVDFSVNDLNNPYAAETFEGVIRQLLSLPEKPAVIVIGNTYYDRGESSQTIQADVCRHYGVPMLSTDTSIYKAVLKGTLHRQDFTPDDLHPNDLGHQLLSEILIHFVNGIKAEPAGDHSETVPYLFSDIYQQTAEVSVELNGFASDGTKRKSIQDRFAEGYTASKKGDSITFTGVGRAIAVAYRQVVSSTDMSPRAIAVVDGDEKHAVVLEGWFGETWGENIRADVIASGLAYGRHTLEIRIDKTHDNDTKPFYLIGAGFAGGRPDIMFMDPVCTHNVWGGTRIRDDFGYSIEGDDIGECWGISAHPNGDGTVDSGVFRGRKLSEIYEKHPDLFYRRNISAASSDEGCPYYDDGTVLTEEKSVFPLLIKIIDAKTDLSIQVHPDDAYAKEHENGSLGKKECWYVLDTPAGGGELVVGHNAKTREELREMVSEGNWDELIRTIPVHKGDFIQIDPGTVHAIKGGMLILETQQNSDITYRVYDYDRLYHGKKRQLHVKQSLDVITVPAASEKNCIIRHDVLDSKLKYNEIEEIYKCDKYTVMRIKVSGNTRVRVSDRFFTASVICGSGAIDGRAVRKGSFFIIPAGYGEAELNGSMEILFSKV